MGRPRCCPDSPTVTAATAAGPRTGDPAAEKITELLMSPPGTAEMIAQTEHLFFSD